MVPWECLPYGWEFLHYRPFQKGMSCRGGCVSIACSYIQSLQLS